MNIFSSVYHATWNIVNIKEKGIDLASEEFTKESQNSATKVDFYPLFGGTPGNLKSSGTDFAFLKL
jgi:hypothetical protein